MTNIHFDSDKCLMHYTIDDNAPKVLNKQITLKESGYYLLPLMKGTPTETAYYQLVGCPTELATNPAIETTPFCLKRIGFVERSTIRHDEGQKFGSMLLCSQEDCSEGALANLNWGVANTFQTKVTEAGITAGSEVSPEILADAIYCYYRDYAEDVSRDLHSELTGVINTSGLDNTIVREAMQLAGFQATTDGATGLEVLSRMFDPEYAEFISKRFGSNEDGHFIEEMLDGSYRPTELQYYIPQPEGLEEAATATEEL